MKSAGSRMSKKKKAEKRRKEKQEDKKNKREEVWNLEWDTRFLVYSCSCKLQYQSSHFSISLNQSPFQPTHVFLPEWADVVSPEPPPLWLVKWFVRFELTKKNTENCLFFGVWVGRFGLMRLLPVTVWYNPENELAKLQIDIVLVSYRTRTRRLRPPSCPFSLWSLRERTWTRWGITIECLCLKEI